MDTAKGSNRPESKDILNRRTNQPKRTSHIVQSDLDENGYWIGERQLKQNTAKIFM